MRQGQSVEVKFQISFSNMPLLGVVSHEKLLVTREIKRQKLYYLKNKNRFPVIIASSEIQANAKPAIS